MRRTLALAAVVLALACGLLWLIFSGERLCDEEKIRAAVDRVERGLEQGNVGQVLDVVSNSYSDSHGMTRALMREGLVHALRNSASFDVVLDVGAPEVSGDEATVQVHADVTVLWGREGNPDTYETDATLTFAREGRSWRCVNAEGWHGMEGNMAGDLGF